MSSETGNLANKIKPINMLTALIGTFLNIKLAFVMSCVRGSYSKENFNKQVNFSNIHFRNSI